MLEKIMSKLPTSTENHDIILNLVKKLISKNFSEEDIIKMCMLTEELNPELEEDVALSPELEEDVALSRMRDIWNRYQ